MTLKRIVITMGDPLGIGPEVIVKALSKPGLLKNASCLLIGVRSVFSKQPRFARLLAQKNLHFADLEAPRKIDAQAAGELSYLALQKAVAVIKQKRVRVLVTAPISKTNIKLAGFAFPGHTEYLCDAFGVKKYAMMLFHPRLRVVLSTIHIPLQAVAGALEQSLILEKLELTVAALRKNFGIRAPKIAVCGLNPHAGEGGLMGEEERQIILPAIEKFRRAQKGKLLRVDGPLPADTVFHQALSGAYDAVLCQYHDQGLIALKTTDFYHGVNLTLGLPFIRTSPDHGTAFDIAGKGLARPESMTAAIRAAKDML